MTVNVKLLPVVVQRPDDFEEAFARIASTSDALFISGDKLLLYNREALVVLAARHRIPAAYPNAQFVAAGGLVGNELSRGFPASRWLSWPGAKRRKARNPAGHGGRKSLVINMKTAKALGLTVPPSLLAGADELVSW
jgi:putative tryptophan/tyrosine transport system substrate-binding protein